MYASKQIREAMVEQAKMTRWREEEEERLEGEREERERMERERRVKVENLDGLELKYSSDGRSGDSSEEDSALNPLHQQSKVEMKLKQEQDANYQNEHDESERSNALSYMLPDCTNDINNDSDTSNDNNHTKTKIDYEQSEGNLLLHQMQNACINFSYLNPNSLHPNLSSPSLSSQPSNHPTIIHLLPHPNHPHIHHPTHKPTPIHSPTCTNNTPSNGSSPSTASPGVASAKPPVSTLTSSYATSASVSASPPSPHYGV